MNTLVGADADDHHHRLDSLVREWLTLPQVAQMQGIDLREVRRQLKDLELLGVRRGPNQAIYIPADFVGPQGPHERLKGTFTVLRDGGMSDEQVISWLFTPDSTLPVAGSPMDALQAGFITEIRRRAMEEAM